MAALETPHVIERDGDRWRVMRMMPAEVATFRERADAALFVAALEGRHEDVAPPPAPAPTPAAPQPAPAPIVAEPAAPEIDEETYATALRRCEAGEGVKAVANDMGIPFARLRGRWANRKSTAAKKRAAGTDLVPGDAPAVPATRAPAKVAGHWTEAEDVIVATADDDELAAFAASSGRSIEAVRKRQEVLAHQVAEEMAR